MFGLGLQEMLLLSLMALIGLLTVAGVAFFAMSRPPRRE